MPFKSAKKRSGQALAGDTGRSSSDRVSMAGRKTFAPPRTKRKRGSEHIENPIETVPVLGTPIISLITATTATATTQTNTDEGIFYWIVDTLATAPSQAQIKAGNDSGDAAAEDSGNAPAANPNVALLTGLTTATAYFFHCYQDNTGPGASEVVSSAEFTML